MKKYSLQLLVLLSVCLIGCSNHNKNADQDENNQIDPEIAVLYETGSEPYQNPELSTSERVSDLLAKMTLEEKAGQILQAERRETGAEATAKYGFGSILSGGGSNPGDNKIEDWTAMIKDYQLAAYSRRLKIPIIYGIDAVHGHSNVIGATIFPHNIGLGAANNPQLVEKMGKIVSQEVLATGINWDFSPCVAVAMDPRWGRTYESFSTDENIVTSLAGAFTKGMHSVGIVACAKHYIGDGGTKYGTGLDGKADRGNTLIDSEELDRLMKPYKKQVELGVQTIMPSYSSINGLKMHAHDSLINTVLKGNMGFDGFIISDWMAIEEIKANSFEEKVWASVNAGVDMLMLPQRWDEAYAAILKGVREGKITQERLDDAVARILKVKFDSGLFEDPLMIKNTFKADSFRTEEAVGVARQLAEQSQVLLKNQEGLLPMKENTKVFVVGEAADNMGLQCGGWTIEWQGKIDSLSKSTSGNTILEGLKKKNVEILTDPEDASEADMVLLVLSEIPYAEMQGDSDDISIIGSHAYTGNEEAIEVAKSVGKPIATVILAGRHQVDIDSYLPEWDAVIMAYLPGSEGGDAIANTLTGEVDFTGKLAMPWYKSVDDINNPEASLLFNIGFGLSYE